MVKSPLNRELVATYEVTLSVIDNASDLPERSVSVPNGKLPLLRPHQGCSEPFRAGVAQEEAPARSQGGQQDSPQGLQGLGHTGTVEGGSQVRLCWRGT